MSEPVTYEQYQAAYERIRNTGDLQYDRPGAAERLTCAALGIAAPPPEPKSRPGDWHSGLARVCWFPTTGRFYFQCPSHVPSEVKAEWLRRVTEALEWEAEQHG